MQAWNTGFAFADGEFGDDQSDFFESLFGRGARAQAGQQSKTGSSKSQEQHTKITIVYWINLISYAVNPTLLMQRMLLRIKRNSA